MARMSCTEVEAPGLLATFRRTAHEVSMERISRTAGGVKGLEA